MIRGWRYHLVKMVGLYRVWRTIEHDTLPEIDLNPKKFFGGDN